MTRNGVSVSKRWVASYFFDVSYFDFIRHAVVNLRNPLYKSLQQADQLERRLQIDIPEFYVGSIVAVTTSDWNLGTRKTVSWEFVFVANVMVSIIILLIAIASIDCVIVICELYNPTILKIETIKLEKRLDTDLSYLQDAYPEFSTFDFNLEVDSHTSGSPRRSTKRKSNCDHRYGVYVVKCMITRESKIFGLKQLRTLNESAL
ncbi:hypothetical protein M3Y98_00624100 [Aphelenchoides besseyi]|nr:hypothetical protein M3Y98_00624100 [Aphelenchoides besseyi]